MYVGWLYANSFQHDTLHLCVWEVTEIVCFSPTAETCAIHWPNDKSLYPSPNDQTGYAKITWFRTSLFIQIHLRRNPMVYNILSSFCPLLDGNYAQGGCNIWISHCYILHLFEGVPSDVPICQLHPKSITCWPGTSQCSISRPACLNDVLHVFSIRTPFSTVGHTKSQSFTSHL